MDRAEENSAALLSGFMNVSKSCGMNNWVTLLQPSSISFLKRPKANLRKDFFVCGHKRNEVRSHASSLLSQK